MTYIVPNYYPNYFPETQPRDYQPQVGLGRVVTYTTPAVIPYKSESELRTEVLAMAHQELLEEFRAKEQNYHVILDVYIQSHNVMPRPDNLKDFIKENSPKMYSTEELIERFNKLYDLVLNKK
jgi:hypothetical protein